jgi:glycosyltransferase involved in cell wall biosynthesis
MISTKQQKLSVIIPAYNEERTINALLERVYAARIELSSRLGIELEVIVVNDGSSDSTKDIVDVYQKEHPKFDLQIISKNNGGKGSAVRMGLEKARGEVIIIQDADLEYNPQEYPRIIAPIIEGRADAVYGSRFLGKPFFSRSTWAIPLHFIGNKMLSLITTILYNKTVSDMETCYKCFKRDCIQHFNLTSNDFTIETEITAKLLKKKLRFVEVPISYKSRSFAEGKKITWRDGVRALIALIKYRF